MTKTHQLDHGGVIACNGSLFLCLLVLDLLVGLVLEDGLKLGLGSFADVIDDDSGDDQDVCDRVDLVDLCFWRWFL